MAVPASVFVIRAVFIGVLISEPVFFRAFKVSGAGWP
jgi:hypothetical protein